MILYTILVSYPHHIAGRIGEEFAVSHLRQHRYRILDRNFRTRNGEIDIIAVDQGEKERVLCFIEVKTRTTLEFGEPLEAISYFKMRALQRTAQFYVLSHTNLPTLHRIDAVAVTLTPDNKLKHIELVKNIS